MAAKHATFSASGAHRWLNCPGSVSLERGLAEPVSSASAAEGTAAHELAELCLREQHGPSEYAGATLPKSGVTVSSHMAACVSIYWLHYVALARANRDHELYVEERVALDKIADDMWGTADCLVYVPADKHVHVLDYKHGAGVHVSADDNPQLAFYALGAAWRFHNRGVVHVTVTVVQPRNGSEPIRSVTYSRADLMEWRSRFEDGRIAALSDGAPRVPGEWCRWCRGLRGACPEVSAAAKEAASSGFEAVALAGSRELGKRLSELPAIKAYIKATEERALAEAQAGRMPYGYKLVEGRGSREWAAPDTLPDQAQQLFPDVNVWKRELRSVADIEREVGKDEFKKRASNLVLRQPGNPTLAPVSDKRRALDTADGY